MTDIYIKEHMKSPERQPAYMSTNLMDSPSRRE